MKNNKITKKYIDSLFNLEIIVERYYPNYNQGAYVTEKAKGRVIFISHSTMDDMPYTRYSGNTPNQAYKTVIRLDNGLEFVINYSDTDSITKLYLSTEVGKALYED
jgi:hypothetical protein